MKDICMKVCDALKLLYLETDVSGMSLGTNLLQMQEGMNCVQGEVPYNAALCSIAFASKSLSNA